jgi:hypothetical protein
MDRAESKKIRDQRSSVLSRYQNQLNVRLIEEDTDGVQERLHLMKKTMEEIEAAHYRYMELIEASDGPDSEAWSNSEKWFEDLVEKYLKYVSKAKKWLKSVGISVAPVKSDSFSSSTSSPSKSDTSLSSEMATLLSLPKVEIPRFDGNAKEYHNFITIFDQVIGNVLRDDQSKLTRLMQHLSGEALHAVKPCALKGGSTGYLRARDILKERFGSVHSVTQCIMNDLKSGKPANKPSDLRHLADEISAASETLTSLGAYNEINTQSFIKDVLKRCHAQVISRWRKYVMKYLSSHDTYPTFDHFATFINKDAKEACDPVYGYDVFKASDMKSNTPSGRDYKSSRAGAVFSANQTKGSVCPVCQMKHEVVQCTKFKSLSPVVRFSEAKKHRLCFGCLAPSHQMRECPKRSQCSVNGCRMKHHILLHLDDMQSPPPPSGEERSPAGHPGAGGVVGGANYSAINPNVQVFLPLVTVLIDNKYPVVALLDQGSTSTLVSERIVHKLKLPTERAESRLVSLGSKNIPIKCEASFSITPFNDNDAVYTLSRVGIVADMPVEVPTGDVLLEKYPHLTDLPLSPVGNDGEADLIIGQDHPHLLIIHGSSIDVDRLGQPYATQTVLGWAVQGPMETVGMTPKVRKLVSNRIVKHDIDAQIQNLWNLEHESDESTAWSQDDKGVYEKWQDETVFIDGHYVVPIPWKPGSPCFPDNRALAEKRLVGTTRKLQKLDMYDAYDQGIQKLVTDGHAEPVPSELLSRDDGKVWYLPHHAVTSVSKPGKVRVVFDCAARYGNISLNSECFQGPDLCNKLIHVLLKFRLHEYAVMADIQAMYLQVRIPYDDRDCLRFLWYVDGKLAQYRMTSHLFGGVWCASSSTFALRKAVVDFPASDETKETVNRSMYVDDMLRSLQTPLQAKTLVNGVRDTLTQGGFHLTKFISNHPEVLSDLSDTDIAQEAKLISSNIESKALGIKWLVSSDEFQYVKNQSLQASGVTKRSMLRSVASLYDPLGLINPVIVKGRMLFQEATRLGKDWDDDITGDLLESWDHWYKSLDHLGQLKFPRNVLSGQGELKYAELHHFSDGSEKAYGACTYLRSVDQENKVVVHLLTSKVRLAPVKMISVPRLELCAAVLSARVEELLRTALGIPLRTSTYWTDSQAVLGYVRNKSQRYKVFVGNRVSYLQGVSSPSQWRYIPSKQNPADVLSRGCLPSDIAAEWFQGPQFLKEKEVTYPPDPQVPQVTDDPEVKKVVYAAVASPQVLSFIDVLISRYSDYNRLLAAVGWWCRFKMWLQVPDQVPKGPLTTSDITKARDILIRHVQGQAYSSEIGNLQDGKPVPAASPLYNLDPVLDDGILVVGGRLRHAHVDTLVKRPIVLPKTHLFSELIMKHFHCRAHTGVEWTLGLLRQAYWIPGARNALRRIRHRCVPCKRWYGKPRDQKMADLPEVRCNQSSKPFQHAGLDLFGPFYVVQRRSTVKRYGCIYTCMATRAVHIEVLPSLETDAFINGFMRFCSRRGFPETVRSDRGTNLVGAQAELAAELKHIDTGKVVRAARDKNVEWTFNTPTASHHGGVWERMIRTIRGVMMAVIPATSLTDDVLSTVFCQVENIVNSRPLTKVSADSRDLEPLTPNHFLVLQTNTLPGWRNFLPGEAMKKKWKQVQNIVHSFWCRWLKEYLPILQHRNKWHRPTKDLAVDDLVLVMDDSLPRRRWPLGLVEKVIQSSDGRVRSLQVRTHGTSLLRPVTKVVPLECE